MELRRRRSFGQRAVRRASRALILLVACLWAPTADLAQAPPAEPACECDAYLAKASDAEAAGSYVLALALLDSAMLHARSGPAEGSSPDDGLVAQVLVRMGVTRQVLGDLDAAQTVFYEALAIRERLHDEMGLAEVLNNIGSIHQYQRNYAKAREYYDRSLRIRERLNQPREVAKAWNNFGALYEDQGRPDSAILFHRRSLAIWQALGDPVWTGLSYLHIGNCHEKLGLADSATTYLRRSAAVLEANNSRYLLGLASVSLGNTLRASGERAEALEWCGRALREAEMLGTVPLQQQACECLYLTHGALGNTAQEFTYFKRYITLRDSVFGQEKTKELMRIELGHTFAQQQLADSLVQAKQRLEAELAYQQDIAREREQRNIFFFGALGVVVLAVALWGRLRYMRRSRRAIQVERDRSDALLLNILPKDIAEELKDHGKATARDIPDVTILFTDFKGFTEMSERLSAQELVAEVDACFRAFDGILERYGVEKIKTIGDAYMAAGGIPLPTADSARNVVLACLDMQHFITDRFTRRSALGLPAFQMRVGIHTGPVVAGIVGKNKFAYDIWGDTVNTASRMESSGEVDRVNISADTWERIKHHTDLLFEPRGLVAAKGKGEMRMYFVRQSSEGAQAGLARHS